MMIRCSRVPGAKAGCYQAQLVSALPVASVRRDESA